MTFTKAAESGNITRFEIYPNLFESESVDEKNKKKPTSLLGGAVELYYYESIFENSVKITTQIVDTGNALPADDGTGGFVELLDGLKVGGGEKIFLDFEDNQGTKLKFSEENALYLNQLRNTTNDYSKGKTFTIDASSKEFFDNELTRVEERYDGKISESVKKIMKEVIKTPKNLDGIEDTINSYNFIGTIKKPFWTITWLAKKSVPKNKGKSAGYLFFETYDGFKYKSLDTLFGQKPKKKYIYNNTAKVPNGYDGKIINPPIMSTNIHLQPKLMMGTYNTEHKQFDFYKSKFELKPFDFHKQEEGIKTAGRDFEFVNSEFTSKPSRITYNISDVGGLPVGVTLSKQLERSKEVNLERQSITNQANMRYNQLGTIQVQVMLVGDFSLRAGDVIECDFPELSSKPNQESSKKMSGIYMIADVCHRITTRNTLTSINLIRDSYGRKTNA
jgi:hypothetical protein